MEEQILWSAEVTNAIREHVAVALSRLDPDRYAQEPAYVSALLARLDGVVYDGHRGYVEFQSTIVADRGPNSAESRWGADFAITASLSYHDKRLKKAVLGQAKKSPLDDLNSTSSRFLDEQCRKMRKATSAALVLAVPWQFGDEPHVRLLGHKEPLASEAIGFADYLVDYLAACRHGDRRGTFVSSVSESHLSRLGLVVRDVGRWLA